MVEETFAGATLGGGWQLNMAGGHAVELGDGYARLLAAAESGPGLAEVLHHVPVLGDFRATAVLDRSGLSSDGALGLVARFMNGESARFYFDGQTGIAGKSEVTASGASQLAAGATATLVLERVGHEVSMWYETTATTLVHTVSSATFCGPVLLGVFLAQATDEASAGILEQLRIDAEAVALAGDANLDGTVSGADYTVWAGNFHHSGAGIDWYAGDFNGDHQITGADYTIWASRFHQSADYPDCDPEEHQLLAIAGEAENLPEPTPLVAMALPALIWSLARFARRRSGRRKQCDCWPRGAE